MSYCTLAWSLAGHAVTLEGRVNIRHGLLVALSYVSESPASERPAHHASRVGFSAMMVRVHLTSLRLKGSTWTPLCGSKAQLVRLRTTGRTRGGKDRRTQSLRVTRAPEAPRPLCRIPKNRTGEGRSLAHANADAGAGRRLRVLACNTHNAGAGPRHEARIRLRTGVRCARQVWWCSRPGRAPRRTGIAAEAI